MEISTHYIALAISTILYSISFAFILRNRQSNYLKIRSPILLLLNNLGSFIMASSFIINEIIKEKLPAESQGTKLFCSLLADNYLIFHFLLFFSFLLRSHRLLSCCRQGFLSGTSSESNKGLDASTGLRTLGEGFYLKLLGFMMLTVVVATMAINLLFKDYLIVPYSFSTCLAGNNSSWIAMIWLVINFTEQVILVTYSYWIFLHEVNYLIKFELIAFTAIWTIFPNVLLMIENSQDLTGLPDETSVITYVCCGCLMVCLLLNAYLPWILAKFSSGFSNFNYFIQACNIDNLYLFLSSEENCFVFYRYLNNHPDHFVRKKTITALKLYCDLMRFRLYFTVERDYYKVLAEARSVYCKYFANEIKPEVLSVLNKEALKSLGEKGLMLEKDAVCQELFDDVIGLCFGYLNQHYEYFKQTKEFDYQRSMAIYKSEVVSLLADVGLLSKH